MKWRRTLVWLLAIGAAVLSFDALRAYALGGPALEGGVIPERTVLDREWLAALWALEIDAMAAAGILGIGMNRRDWRAWAMFLLAAVASLGFQVVTPPVELARAVPPVALFLAIVILEIRTGGVPATEESMAREGSTPRPPGRDAGRVAVAGNLDAQETGRLGPGHPARGSATPPHSPVPTSVADSRDVEGASLPDQPRPVTPVATPPTDRDQTVAPLEAKHDEALRRRKNRPDEFARYITDHDLDRDAIMARAARRRWPVANGHRKAVPA